MKVQQSSIKILKLCGIILSFNIICACSFFNTSKKREALSQESMKKSLVTNIQPRWFKTLKRFELQSESELTKVHLFYDVMPEFSRNNSNLNVIITTPEGSEYAHELDMASGQLFVDRKFCSQSDIYGKNLTEVYKPPFSLGVVPRVFDQLNTPQKIIVFGEKSYHQEYYKTHFFDVKVVGGYIEQVCEKGLCTEASDWLSRLVLVGVQPDYKAYKGVENIDELVAKLKWDEIVAFIENGFGHNVSAKEKYPAYRMGALIDATQALHFMGNNSRFLSNEQLSKTRMACYKLYDYVYRYLSLDSSTFDKAQEPNTREIKIGDDYLREKEVKSFKLNEKNLKFYQRFKRVFTKYHNEYKTCAKYVYSSNINSDPDRHWFMTYYTAFHLLHDLGYYFDCSRQNWISNPFVGLKKRAVEVSMQFRDCSDKDIDRAMMLSVQFLDNLRISKRSSYRYIDYDNYRFGTHNKIYSWVKFNNKFLQCSQDEKGKYFRDSFRKFPQDIRWKAKATKDNRNVKGIGTIIE